MTAKPFFATLMAVFLLGACQASLPAMLEPEEVVTRDMAPPGAAPGTCWGRDITPATIETVTEQVMLQPAVILDDGTLAEPAIYKTETRQQIVKERRETWFETPCDHEMTPEFTATLQRALQARGLYRGPIHGQLDGRTRRAIRAYQKPQGLDSSVLSIAAARQMGLIAVRTDPPETAIETPPEPVAVAAADSGPSQADLDAFAAKEAAEIARVEQAAKAAEIARAEEARRAAEAARAEEARRAEEAARKAAAEKAAEDARQAEARKAEEAARAEKARRAAELAAALEAEKAAKSKARKSLPISSESY